MSRGDSMTSNWGYCDATSAALPCFYIVVGDQKGEPEVPRIIRRRRLPKILHRQHLEHEKQVQENDKHFTINRSKSLMVDKRWKTKKGLWRYKLKR
jgi:hypothetical protein